MNMQPMILQHTAFETFNGKHFVVELVGRSKKKKPHERFFL